MTRYLPEDGRWHANLESRVLAELQKQFSAEQYERQKQALKQYLCNYFSTEANCDARQGRAISPIGSTKGGGKVLKVRWGLPGCGKSGGLRLVVVAYCDQLRVFIAEAFHRSDDPQTEDMLEAAGDGD